MPAAPTSIRSGAARSSGTRAKASTWAAVSMSYQQPASFAGQQDTPRPHLIGESACLLHLETGTHTVAAGGKSVNDGGRGAKDVNDHGDGILQPGLRRQLGQQEDVHLALVGHRR